MGDKTQLLALILAARFKRPWTIMAGVFVATILNHALASWAGVWISSWLSAETLKWVLAFTFLAFAAWILVPDKEGDVKGDGRFGPFLTTVIAFFLAEMGDKTQFATVALGARYSQAWLVTVGSTMGMMGSNALAVFFGDRLLHRIPMKWIRILAAVLFAAFALAIALT